MHVLVCENIAIRNEEEEIKLNISNFGWIADLNVQIRGKRFLSLSLPLSHLFNFKIIYALEVILV